MSPPPFMNTSTPQPPWHMWGGSTYWTLQGQVLEGLGSVSAVFANQVCKISYRRPETWAFWFSASLLEFGPIPNTPNTGPSVEIFWDVIVGVGRSSFNTALRSPTGGINGGIPADGFCRMRWNLDVNGFAPSRKYTTQVRGPRLDDGLEPEHPDFFGFLIDRVTAEDIQVLATLKFEKATLGLAPGSRIVVEAQSYWAPLSHVRPDWYAGMNGNFLGGETGGT